MRSLRWLILAVVAASGCGPADPPHASRPAVAGTIVSLSPAFTATLAELGLVGRVAGRTRWCEGADDAAVVGSLDEVDLERLAAIDPDLVLVQRSARGVPEGLARAAASHGWRVELVACDTLADMRGMAKSIAVLAGCPEASTASDRRWTEVTRTPQAFRKGERVTFLLPGEEPRAFASDTYLAELWKGWGGQIWPPGGGWPAVQVEDVLRAAPDRVFVVGRADAPLVRALRERGLHVTPMEDPGLLRPGPALLRSLEGWRSRMESAR